MLPLLIILHSIKLGKNPSPKICYIKYDIDLSEILYYKYGYCLCFPILIPPPHLIPQITANVAFPQVASAICSESNFFQKWCDLV